MHENYNTLVIQQYIIHMIQHSSCVGKFQFYKVSFTLQKNLVITHIPCINKYWRNQYLIIKCIWRHFFLSLMKNYHRTFCKCAITSSHFKYSSAATKFPSWAMPTYCLRAYTTYPRQHLSESMAVTVFKSLWSHTH